MNRWYKYVLYACIALVLIIFFGIGKEGTEFTIANIIQALSLFMLLFGLIYLIEYLKKRL
jgi:hypothetical protein